MTPIADGSVIIQTTALVRSLDPLLFPERSLSPVFAGVSLRFRSALA